MKKRIQVLQSEIKDYCELISLVSTTPAENILQVQRDLRAAPEPLAYLATARGVPGSLQSPSSMESDVDKLASRYLIAYPVLPPIQLTTDDLKPRLTVPVLETEWSQIGSPTLSNPAALLKARPDSTDPLKSLTATLARGLCAPHQLSAPTSLSYIEKRLQLLQIKYWTSVQISNELAAIVISSYLEVDHPFYAFFDAELFVQSLVDQETTFCGTFLVNSLLSQACVSCHP